jgi:hypothetical protein
VSEELVTFSIPYLEGHDSALQVIEMTFVRPPYFLDFGKVRLDRPPEYFYDPQLIANTMHEWRDKFGDRWKEVASALEYLKREFGIYYMDPRPGNITLETMTTI